MLAMLRKLLASSAVTGPTLKSLGTNFGLAPLIGKQLAIIDDLRVGSPKDQDVLIENMLKITGRGLFTIDRKFKTAWTGMLSAKLMLVSNLIPKLGDDSAALASRIITLSTRVSFYGRENSRLLEDKLAPELAGVFYWALEGLRRLRERGRFLETTASKDARERLANLGSPARAFLAERCVLDPKEYVEKRELYEVWCSYSAENNSYPGTLEKFCEALYAAAGGLVRSGRPWATVKDKDGKDRKQQINACMGIRLQETETNSFSEAADAQAGFYRSKGKKL
jgi:putative DNA primase/helicase